MKSNPLVGSLPSDLLQPLLLQVAQDHPALQRRILALNILWQERYLTRPQLITRIEAELGRGCFGKQPVLAFARDIKFVRGVLQESGLALQYSRRKHQTGYYIPARPGFSPFLTKIIRATVQEIHPQQTKIYAQLTPADRVEQGAALSEALLSQAASRLSKEDPSLSRLEARRKALSRMYTLEKMRL